MSLFSNLYSTLFSTLFREARAFIGTAITALALVLPLSVSAQLGTAQQTHQDLSDKDVLIVLTSHNKMGDLDEKTGFWLSEMTHPYYVLVDAGVNVDIASIEGAMAPIDPRSMELDDKSNQRFLDDKKLMAMVINSVPLAEVDASDYDAVIYAGGHGTMWDFSNNPVVNEFTAKIYESQGITAAICHGPAAFTDVKLSNGEYLVAGKKVAAFTNEEEEIVKLTDAVPFLLQDKLVERGAKHVYAKPWQSNVVVDERLVTGQNPQSAHAVGEAVLALLAK